MLFEAKTNKRRCEPHGQIKNERRKDEQTTNKQRTKDEETTNKRRTNNEQKMKNSGTNLGS